MQMSDDDSEYETIPKKRKIKEISIPNGLVNGPVKHKKIKPHMQQKNYFLYIHYVRLLVCVDLAKHMQW